MTNSLRLWDPATIPPFAAIPPRLPQNFAGRREWLGIQTDMRTEKGVEREMEIVFFKARSASSSSVPLLFSLLRLLLFLIFFPGNKASRVYRLLRSPAASPSWITLYSVFCRWSYRSLCMYLFLGEGFVCCHSKQYKSFKLIIFKKIIIII